MLCGSRADNCSDSWLRQHGGVWLFHPRRADGPGQIVVNMLQWAAFALQLNMSYGGVVFPRAERLSARNARHQEVNNFDAIAQAFACLPVATFDDQSGERLSTSPPDRRASGITITTQLRSIAGLRARTLPRDYTALTKAASSREEAIYVQPVPHELSRMITPPSWAFSPPPTPSGSVPLVDPRFVAQLRAQRPRCVQQLPSFFARGRLPAAQGGLRPLAVAVHIRRGDVSRGFRFIGLEVFAELIALVRHLRPDADVHVFTERSRLGENLTRLGAHIHYPSAAPWGSALAAFSRSDLFMMSTESMYSALGGLLNDRCVVVSIPCGKPTWSGCLPAGQTPPNWLHARAPRPGAVDSRSVREYNLELLRGCIAKLESFGERVK